jgi:hypothetical protein
MGFRRKCVRNEVVSLAEAEIEAEDRVEEEANGSRVSGRKRAMAEARLPGRQALTHPSSA